MRRLIILACLVTSAAALAPSAQGAEPGRVVWHKFWSGYYRNKHWPEPFQTLDRHSVMQPLELMKNNGWRLHNTLGDELFTRETQELTRAAEIKVHWIATQAPLARRTVFVYGSEHDPNTQTRVAGVQSYVNQLYPGGDGPSVLVTNIIPHAASGEIFNQVISGYRDSLPAPVLPGAGGGGGGGTP